LQNKSRKTNPTKKQLKNPFLNESNASSTFDKANKQSYKLSNHQKILYTPKILPVNKKETGKMGYASSPKVFFRTNLHEYI
jgi:hypothetical protein